MIEVQVNGDILNNIADLYESTDYFGYEYEYKCISNIDINFKFNNDIELISSIEQVPNYFTKVYFHPKCKASLIFDNEEDALYFKLKYC